MLFYDVAQHFQALEQESSRLAMTKILAHVFEKATPNEIRILSYLSLGELKPPYEGTQFALAEKSLLKVGAQLLDVSEQEIAAETKKAGDIGLVLEQGIWQPEKKLTIEQVYEKLCAIEEIHGTGSQEEKINQMHVLLKSLDPLSAKYVARIVLGKLRMGFSDMTIIDALSWMVTGNKSLRTQLEDAYNICADIGLIAQTLKEKGIKAIEHMHIQLGIPIRPAAAERLPTAKAIMEKLGPCVAQPKLDGFRLQVHLDNSGKETKLHFFSRNLIDMSNMFPDLAHAFKQLNVEQLIIEGEAIVYDPQTGIFLPFQETVKRKRKHDIEEVMSSLPLQFFAFDILYLNGQSMLDKTHEERRAAMLKLFHNFPDKTIQVISEQPITSAAQLEEYFYSNVSAGLEGIVVKRPDAIYQPGKRNFNWIKLKREMEGHLEDTIDCVILGYYAGKGKRTQFGVGAFLVGVYNKVHDRFETIAKIGTGMTDEQWIDLKKRCDEYKVSQKPHNVVCAKELQPDVWVEPELVCTIRADEITMSPLHSAGKTLEHLGYALRFPRFEDYRIDKSAFDITQVNEIRHMYDDQFKK